MDRSKQTGPFGSDRYGVVAEAGVANLPLGVLRYREALGLSLAEALVTGLAMEFLKAGSTKAWVVVSALVAKSAISRSVAYGTFQRLMEAGLLVPVALRGRTKVFDFAPLLDRLAAVHAEARREEPVVDALEPMPPKELRALDVETDPEVEQLAELLRQEGASRGAM
jgi:hypothetical protein